MTKARAKTASKKSTKGSRAGTGSSKPVDLPAIRQEITNLVGNHALDMVETTVEEAKKGHYAAMKYLFDLIGLHPAEAQEESSGEDSMARTLLRRLGLPEEPRLENEVTKECPPETGAGQGMA